MKLLYKIGIGVGIVILLYVSIVFYLVEKDTKKSPSQCYMSDEFNLSNDYIKSRLDNIDRLLDNDSYLNHGLKTT